MTHTFQIKIYEAQDETKSAEIIKSAQGKDAIEALQQKLGDVIEKTDFFRKGTDDNGRPFKMYDVLRKAGGTFRAVVTQLTDEPEGATVNGKPEADAKKKTAAATKVDDRAMCTGRVWWKGAWAPCERKEQTKGSGKCHQEHKAWNAHVAAGGTAEMTTTPTAAKPAAAPAGKSDLETITEVILGKPKTAKKPVVTKVKGKEVKPNFKAPKAAKKAKATV
jgi:hypothetical protein